MTPRQLAFATQYALDHNGAQAAIRAGYSSKAARQTASELLTNPNVQAAVAHHEAQAAQELGLTREKVLEGLRDALEMARRQDNPVAMVAALREAAKISGFYAPERQKIEVSVDGEALQRRIAEATDEELLAIIDGRPIAA
jgi:phage terminase small subunit